MSKNISIALPLHVTFYKKKSNDGDPLAQSNALIIQILVFNFVFRWI